MRRLPATEKLAVRALALLATCACRAGAVFHPDVGAHCATDEYDEVG